jgi:hypothetical protein
MPNLSPELAQQVTREIVGAIMRPEPKPEESADADT